MDIHKPKAAHSMREFMIEIGTITIGILIALSLEAGVEAYHNHLTVEHARADLRKELSGNREVLSRTIKADQEAVRTIDALSAYGKAVLSGGNATVPTASLSTTFGKMNTAAWESTLGTQALVHMPYDEAQTLSRIYAGNRAYNDLESLAVEHWFELAALPDDPAELSKEELKAAMRALAINRGYQVSLELTATDLMKNYDATLAALGKE